MTKLKIKNLFYSISVLSLIILTCLTISASTEKPPENPPEKNPENYLSEGKGYLDRGDYENAVILLTTACEKLPALSDYALLWRAKAHERKGDINKALADLKTIKEKHSDSPLIKNVKQQEIELMEKAKDPKIAEFFEGFVREYPNEMIVKYAYAAYLKNNNETEKARKIFKEIYLSVSPFSKDALDELSPSDITTEDLIKRGRNLNNAWLFKEAEKCFREALKKATKQLKKDIIEGLAHSLFRQKRYGESAELYKAINNHYWRARSLLRSGDIDAFESELVKLLKTGDPRNGSILIAYGIKKKRDGDIKRAIETFKTALSQYPSAKEEALWATGWTYYISRDYANALDIFSQLYDTYGALRYLYWKNRCLENVDEQKPLKLPAQKNTLQSRNFYSFLFMLKNKQPVSPVKKISLNTLINSRPSERIDMLTKLGFKNEAITELLHRSNKNPDTDELIYICSYLNNLGNYKMAINLISKVSYSEELHELFYPIVHWPAVEEASRENELDPLLILSIMREESRFAADARSIAGALGLMQLMPHTASRLSRHIKLNLKHSDELYDAKTNILIGSYYLKHLIKTFNSIPVALAAYNAGEEAVKEWLKKGKYNTIDEFIEDIPYSETQNYVKKVMTTYFEYMRAGDAMDISSTLKYFGNL
ncbi:MAG: hypothetical protein C0415_06160 [Thermodesulfovibrio sp.]|nr:hypothetical protein [Thermodesulfovibrio sp.]